MKTEVLLLRKLSSSICCCFDSHQLSSPTSLSDKERLFLVNQYRKKLNNIFHRGLTWASRNMLNNISLRFLLNYICRDKYFVKRTTRLRMGKWKSYLLADLPVHVLSLASISEHEN